MSSAFGMTANRSFCCCAAPDAPCVPAVSCLLHAATIATAAAANTTRMRRIETLLLFAAFQQQLVHHDNDNHGEADDQAIVERRPGDLRKCIPQDAEDQRAENSAHDRAAPPREARPADNGGGDDVELVASREVSLALPLHEREHD